jgi:hypothetical protein
LHKVKPETEQLILKYLRKNVKLGHRYFKARHIAEEIGLHSHMVGTTISLLRQRETGLHIQAWSGSKATTWRVDPL